MLPAKNGGAAQKTEAALARVAPPPIQTPSARTFRPAPCLHGTCRPSFYRERRWTMDQDHLEQQAFFRADEQTPEGLPV